MNKILTLFKLDIYNSFNIADLKDKNKRKRIFLVMFALLGLIPLYGIILRSISGMHDILLKLNQEIFFLQLGIVLSQFLILFLGMPHVINKFYFSKDIDSLLTLPIKATDIMSSKFLSLVVQEYLIVFPIFIPFILNFGFKNNTSILYWLNSLIVLLLIPIFPLVIITIITMLLMKYTNIGSKKNIFRVVVPVIFIFLIIFGQLKLQQSLGNNMDITEEALLKLVEDSNYLIERVGVFFPLGLFGAKFLSGFKVNFILANGAIFIGINIISFLVMILFSKKIYFEGLITGGAVRKKAKNKSRNISLKYKKNKPYYSLMKREIISIIKTPVYLLNTIVGMFMMPLILFMMLKTAGENLELINNFYLDNRLVFLSVIIIGQVGLNLGTSASTSFSREGKSFWLQRTLPIKTEDQIKSRILSSFIVQWIGMIAMLITIIYFSKMSIVDILIVTISGAILLIPSIQINLLVDVSNPKLDWTSPQQAMKQNTNVIISMGFNFIYLAAISIITYILYSIIKSELIFLVLSILGILFIKIFNKPLTNSINETILELE